VPSLSIDAWLQREIALSKPEARYTDMGLCLRRLTVEPIAALRLTAGMKLQSSDGVEWRIPKHSFDDKLPIATADLPLAHKYRGGELLYHNGVAVGRLVEERLLESGGVWDRIVRDWQCDERGRIPSASPLVVQVRESQVAFCRFFASQFERMRRGEPLQQQGALAYGKTRSGKTVIALLCLLALAVDMPKVRGKQTVVVLVSVNHPARAELDRELRTPIPASWYTYREAATGATPAHSYTLINGAQIVHKTSEDPDELRSAGMITSALLNEAGRMPELAFTNVMNKLKDQDGLALLASNRPQRSKANWVAELGKLVAADEKAGRPLDFRFFNLDPQLNDAIDAGAADRIGRILRALNPDVDEQEGALLTVGDFIYASAFDDVANVTAVPETLPDITRIVTKKVLNFERDFFVAADFQARPGCVATVWKVYGHLPDKWVLWCLNVVWAEDGGELALIDALEDAGIDADNAVVIADASNEWQDAAHSRKGLNSFQYFKNRRFVIRGPQPKKDRPYGSNPRPKEVQVQRLREALKETRSNGLRTLMISDDVLCKSLVEDFKKCRAVKGRSGPIPGGQHAHAPDTAGYVLWAIRLVLQPFEVAAKQAAQGHSYKPLHASLRR